MEWLDTVRTMLLLPAPAYRILIAIGFAVLVVGLVREMRKGAASPSQDALPLWRRAISAMAQLFVLLIGLAGIFLLTDWVAAAIFVALVTIWLVIAALLSRRARLLATGSSAGPSTNGISRFMLEPKVKALIRRELDRLQTTSPAVDSSAISTTVEAKASSQDIVDEEIGSTGYQRGDGTLESGTLEDGTLEGDREEVSSLPIQPIRSNRPLLLSNGRTARLKERPPLGKQTIRAFQVVKAR